MIQTILSHFAILKSLLDFFGTTKHSVWIIFPAGTNFCFIELVHNLTAIWNEGTAAIPGPAQFNCSLLQRLKLTAWECFKGWGLTKLHDICQFFLMQGKLLRGQQTYTSITCIVNIGRVVISFFIESSLEGRGLSFGLVWFAFVLLLRVVAYSYLGLLVWLLNPCPYSALGAQFWRPWSSDITESHSLC